MKENTQDNEDKIPTAPLEDFKVKEKNVNAAVKMV